MMNTGLEMPPYPLFPNNFWLSGWELTMNGITMEHNTSCRIWRTPASIKASEGDGDIIDSPRAGGRYQITGRAVAILQNRSVQLKARVTSWLIAQRRLGVRNPSISPGTIDDAEHRKSLTVQQRVENLLRFFQIHTSHIGSNCEVFPRKPNQNHNEMRALAWSESNECSELIYLLNYLDSMQWVEAVGRGYRLTVDGYRRLAELEGSVSASSKAFVAMWFHESMADIWDKGINPAIRDAGYEAVRIDQKEHVNKIDDEIIAEIRRTRFVVADFTQGDDGPRGGVYYEAGFAHGLDIPVIFTCRSDALGKVHFDTRQYNHIVWKTADQLRDRLTKRIAAVIGDGPFKGGDSK